MSLPDLKTDLGFVTLENPVMSASGTFGYGLELADFCPPEALGAVVPKGISLKPWPGNPLPRAAETAGGLLNAIGLENMGVERFLSEALPPLKARGARVGVNILGKTAEEYAELCRRLTDAPVDFIELNISCPNLHGGGGLSFGADPAAAGRLVALSREAAGKVPLVAKLPPLVSDIALLAKICEDNGCRALSLINSVPALAIDHRSGRPLLGNVTGGLSGPPVKPLALRQVFAAASAVKIPVIGLGGISTAADALEFFLAGAAAVQVGSATLADPRAPLSILEGVRDFLRERGENLEDYKKLALTAGKGRLP
ncbi:MAG: dihydroorotate dehydrogenase [Deltaproteobacteria bacterium]|jgi:dihydroorotate dehydrogenase (NAD+) catalytic subunit|nr:dihydroorotate dehydrogenase [Deltaproteobacteria bacterium]